MVAIIRDVYDQAAVERAERGSMASVVTSEEASHISSVLDEALIRSLEENLKRAVGSGGSRATNPASPAADPATKKSPNVTAKQSGGSAAAKTGSDAPKAGSEATSPKDKRADKDKSAKEKDAAKGKSVPRENKH
ncbi:hypothetical protein V5799_022608 [Amblyomma americanum]|uniref:Uncharacterized protein n=1 Tax=Amblyomma americanum TaxID=6943 RepID=A0AAQ4FLJ6_AMBAM